MNKLNYYKYVYLKRFFKIFRAIDFYKFIISIIFILLGILLIKYGNTLEIASIIAGTGFALLISVIFDYFMERDRIRKLKINFVEELGIDVEKTRFYKFSKQFEEDIISRLLYLNARPQPLFLRSEGSVGVLKIIRELTGDLIVIEDSNKFILKPLVNLAFSCMTGSHGKKLNRFMKKNRIEEMTSFMNKQLKKTLNSIFWSLHNNSKIEELFLLEVNKRIENYLRIYNKHTSPDEFINLYLEIATKCICYKGLAREKLHFRENGAIYVFEGNEKSVRLAINGLKNIQKTFPEKSKLIQKNILSIEQRLNKYKNIKKFKVDELNSDLMKEFLFERKGGVHDI